MKYMKKLDNKKLYEAMSENALIKIKSMTIEHMVNDHVHLLKTIGNEETS
jgi:RNA:NAD 2'-phosphotransferase (TPT1/KptA family)